MTISRDGREVISDCICEDAAATVTKLHNLARALFGEHFCLNSDLQFRHNFDTHMHI